MSDTQKELQADKETPLKTMWFETRSGVRYEMPDMLTEHIAAAHKELDYMNNVTVTNVSEVVMVLPKRIIIRSGVGNRCFWEEA